MGRSITKTAPVIQGGKTPRERVSKALGNPTFPLTARGNRWQPYGATHANARKQRDNEIGAERQRSDPLGNKALLAFGCVALGGFSFGGQEMLEQVVKTEPTPNRLEDVRKCESLADTIGLKVRRRMLEGHERGKLGSDRR